MPDDDCRPTDLADLTIYYVSASMGVSQHFSVRAIRTQLSSLPRGAVLYCLSTTSKRAEAVPFNDAQAKLALTKWLFPADVAQRVGQIIRADPGAHPASAQIVLNLALHALDVCPEDRWAPPPDLLTRRLGVLLLALAEHFEQQPDDGETMAVELTRIGLFHANEEQSLWLELAGRLFLEVIPTMTDDPDYTDIDSVIQNAHGMTFERFWAITAVESIAARHSDEVTFLPMRVEGWNVTANEELRWTRAWARHIDATAEAARRDLARGTGWSFEAFADYPLIWPTDREDRALAIRPAGLPSKATAYGMFWAIRHPLVASGGKHETWSQFFGRAEERLGRTLLAEHLPADLTIFTEDDARTWGPGKNCDVVIADADTVAMDFVYRQFTAASAGLGDFADLGSDLGRAADKFEQVDDTLAKGLQGGHFSPQRIYPVVVIGGPYPVNPFTAKAVRTLVAAKNPAVIGVDPRCRPPMIVDLASFFQLLQAAHAHSLRVPDILQAWADSPQADATFRNWLVTDGPGPPNVSTFHDRVYAAVGLPSRGGRQLS